MEIIDVKQNLTEPHIFELLKPSVFNPTTERLKARAEKYQTNPNAHIFACRKGGNFVGIAVVEIVNNTATVLDIAVDENNRNKGIGSALLTYFIDNFKIKIMLAETDDDAVLFYQKFGFKITETKTVYDTKRYLCVYKKVFN